ncbi:MAG: threonylcarbamoyl-AMP synthase [Gammaproteobacteria bacterium]|nr:threonylcarbamoyl-AMP synthase [Gammaproteobacteria bacterium]
MKLIKNIDEAQILLDAGKVIAYPTEAVYGLGCDIWNEKAVLHLLALKNRPKEKGLIILISSWAQLWPLVDMSHVSDTRLKAVKETWPGPVTWVFPKSEAVPAWISGTHDGIAIRMTKHSVAHALCQNGPIVSTSANLSGGLPARDVDTLRRLFPEGLLGVVAGELGGNFAVSEIYNILDGSSLRK